MRPPSAARSLLTALTLLAMTSLLACGKVEQDGGSVGSGGDDGSGGSAGSGSAGSGGSGDVILIPYACGTQREFGLDADGDGFAQPLTYSAAECVAAGPGADGFPLPDCDDTDPERHAVAFFDEDGDGYGGVESAICLGEVIPPDAMNDGSDCDDDDPGAFPDAPDSPGDDADTNCDGVDGGAPPDPEGPTLYDNFDADLTLTEPCTEADQPIRLTFGWRDIVCTTIDGLPAPYGSARAQVTFRNPGPEPTPATTAVLTSPWDNDFERHLDVPSLAPDESTVPYMLGWIAPTVSLTFQAADGTTCTEPYETESLGECVTE